MRHSYSRKLLSLLAYIAEREANRSLSGGFRELEAEIIDGERRHRAFGRRLCRGDIGPLDTMGNVVNMFAARVAFQPAKTVHKNGSAAGIRREWLLGERLYDGAWSQARKDGMKRAEVLAFLDSLNYPIVHSERSDCLARGVVVRLGNRRARKDRAEARALAARGGRCARLPDRPWWLATCDGQRWERCIDLRARRTTKGGRCRVDGAERPTAGKVCQ